MSEINIREIIHNEAFANFILHFYLTRRGRNLIKYHFSYSEWKGDVEMFKNCDNKYPIDSIMYYKTKWDYLPEQEKLSMRNMGPTTYEEIDEFFSKIIVS